MALTDFIAGQPSVPLAWCCRRADAYGASNSAWKTEAQHEYLAILDFALCQFKDRLTLPANAPRRDRISQAITLLSNGSLQPDLFANPQGSTR